MAGAGGVFAFDHARHLAAGELRPEHYSDFQRLAKDLCYGSAFQLLISEFNDVLYRDALIERLDAVLAAAGIRQARLVLSTDLHADFTAVEIALTAVAAEHYGVIHAVGGETWFDAKRFEAFNIRREAVARHVPARIILWLTTEHIAGLSRLAPDLWAWRGGVFSFATAARPLPALPVAQLGPIDTRSLAERGRRIAELRAHLAALPPLPEDLKLQLFDELAGLSESLGQLDEALRIRREEQLPVYERLGDVREKAVTQGKIADILQARGQLDEALRIRREEELPVYERLGDVRTLLLCQVEIALNLMARGRPEDRDEIARLLAEARAAAERLSIPEAEQIRAFQRRLGLAGV